VDDPDLTLILPFRGYFPMEGDPGVTCKRVHLVRMRCAPAHVVRSSGMIAIDWRYGGVLIVELLLTSAGIYFFSRATKIRTLLLRIAVSVICLFVSLLGSLAVLASLAFSGCETHSPMVYSPSGKIAARANNFDEGATGGETSVTLHWAHGLRSQTVYGGGWKSVGPSDIKWMNDSELIIRYDSVYAAQPACSSTSQVKVSCVPR